LRSRARAKNRRGHTRRAAAYYTDFRFFCHNKNLKIKGISKNLIFRYKIAIFEP
jgi:hypothetical protein